MHLPFDDLRYWPLATSNVNYFLFVADTKCGLYEINKINRAKMLHMDRVSPIQKKFRDQTKAMLDRRRSGSGPWTWTWTCTHTTINMDRIRHLTRLYYKISEPFNYFLCVPNNTTIILFNFCVKISFMQQIHFSVECGLLDLQEEKCLTSVQHDNENSNNNSKLIV